MKYYKEQIKDAKLGDLLLDRDNAVVTLYKVLDTGLQELLKIDASLDSYSAIESVFGDTYNKDRTQDKFIRSNVYIRMCDGNRFINVDAKSKVQELAKCDAVKFYTAEREELIDYINDYMDEDEEIKYTDKSKDMNTLLNMLMQISEVDNLIESVIVYNEAPIIKMEYALASSIWANRQDVYADGNKLAIRAGAVVMMQDDNLNFMVGQVNEDEQTIRTITLADIDLTVIGIEDDDE